MKMCSLFLPKYRLMWNNCFKRKTNSLRAKKKKKEKPKTSKSKWHLGRTACFPRERKWQSVSPDSADLFPDPGPETGKSQSSALSSPSAKMMPSQEVFSATLRWPRAAPYCPWGKEIGNPTADIQAVRKSSWLCLQNLSSIRWLLASSPALGQTTSASYLIISLASSLASFLPLCLTSNSGSGKQIMSHPCRKPSGVSSVTRIWLSHCSHMLGVPCPDPHDRLLSSLTSLLKCHLPCDAYLGCMI